MRVQRAITAAAAVGCLSGLAMGQWNPNAGQWGKTDPNDLRVMTWNVRDTLCTTNTKNNTVNDWHAMVRIIQLLQPDILILQETGDNSGNGTGSGVDSPANLTTTCQLMIQGGADPFKGTPATTFVQNWAPGYDLPHVFVGTVTDNFNRNIIMSRYPFADLNGDSRSTYSDIPTVSTFSVPGKWCPGGGGGIRGFLFAEIDLPGQYAGDLVMGCAHLKSGGASSDLAERLAASQNVAWVIEQWYNGAGTGAPDPAGIVLDNPQAQQILDANTPVVIGGDWNEDEQTNGRRGPAAWLSEAEFAGGSDGTDRDPGRSDATLDTSTDLAGSRTTQNSGSKLDYLMWQDSIVTARRSFVFNSANITGGVVKPAEWSDIGSVTGLSGTASDHRAVVVDLIMPMNSVTGACCIDGVCSDLAEETCLESFGIYLGDGTSCALDECPATGACCLGVECLVTTLADCATLTGNYLGDDTTCDIGACLPTGACCFACAAPIEAPCPIPGNSGPACVEMNQAACLELGGLYQGDGQACENNPSFCACLGDVNGDGFTNAADFTILAGQFGQGTPDCRERWQGDLNCDGVVNASDFTILAGSFGCGS